MDSKRFQELVEESTYNHGSFADLYTCGICDMKMWADNIHEHLQSHVSVCTNYQFNNETKTIVPVFDSPIKPVVATQKRKLPAPKTGIKQKVNVQSPSKTSLYMSPTYEQRSDSEVENYLNSSAGHVDRLSVVLDQVEHAQTYFAARPITTSEFQSSTQSIATAVQSTSKKKGKQQKKKNSAKGTKIEYEAVKERAVVQRTAVAQPSQYGPLGIGEIVTKIDLPYVVEKARLGTYHCSVKIDSFTPNSVVERAVPLRNIDGQFLRQDDIAGAVESKLRAELSSSDEESDEETEQSQPMELLNAIDSITTTPKTHSVAKLFGLEKNIKKKKKGTRKKYRKFNQTPFSGFTSRDRLKKSLVSFEWTVEPLASYIQSELKRRLMHMSAGHSSLETYFESIIIIEEFDIGQWIMKNLDKDIEVMDAAIDVADPEELRMTVVMETVSIKQESITDIEKGESASINHTNNPTTSAFDRGKTGLIEMKQPSNTVPVKITNQLMTLSKSVKQKNIKLNSNTNLQNNILNVGTSKARQNMPNDGSYDVNNSELNESNLCVKQNPLNVMNSVVKQYPWPFNVSNSGGKQSVPSVSSSGVKQSTLNAINSGVNQNMSNVNSPGVKESTLSVSNSGVKQNMSNVSSSGVKQSTLSVSNIGVKQNMSNFKNPGVKQSTSNVKNSGVKQSTQNVSNFRVQENMSNISSSFVKQSTTNVSNSSVKQSMSKVRNSGIKESTPNVIRSGVKQNTLNASKSSEKQSTLNTSNNKCLQQSVGICSNINSKKDKGQLTMTNAGQTSHLNLPNTGTSSNLSQPQNQTIGLINMAAPNNVISYPTSVPLFNTYQPSLQSVNNAPTIFITRNPQIQEQQQFGLTLNLQLPLIVKDSAGQVGFQGSQMTSSTSTDTAIKQGSENTSAVTEGTGKIGSTVKHASGKKDSDVKQATVKGNSSRKQGTVNTDSDGKQKTESTASAVKQAIGKLDSARKQGTGNTAIAVKQAIELIDSARKQGPGKIDSARKQITGCKDSTIKDRNRASCVVEKDTEKMCKNNSKSVKYVSGIEQCRTSEDEELELVGFEIEDSGSGDDCDNIKQAELQGGKSVVKKDLRLEKNPSKKLVYARLIEKEDGTKELVQMHDLEPKIAKVVTGNLEKKLDSMKQLSHNLKDKDETSCDEDESENEVTIMLLSDSDEQSDDQEEGEQNSFQSDASKIDRKNQSSQSVERHYLSHETQQNKDHTYSVKGKKTADTPKVTTTVQQPNSIFIPFSSPLYVQQPLTAINQQLLIPSLQQTPLVYNQGPFISQTIYPSVQQQTFIPQMQQFGTNTFQLPQQTIQLPIISDFQNVSNTDIHKQSNTKSKTGEKCNTTTNINKSSTQSKSSEKITHIEKVDKSTKESKTLRKNDVIKKVDKIDKKNKSVEKCEIQEKVDEWDKIIENALKTKSEAVGSASRDDGKETVQSSSKDSLFDSADNTVLDEKNDELIHGDNSLKVLANKATEHADEVKQVTKVSDEKPSKISEISISRKELLDACLTNVFKNKLIESNKICKSSTKDTGQSTTSNKEADTKDKGEKGKELLNNDMFQTFVKKQDQVSEKEKQQTITLKDDAFISEGETDVNMDDANEEMEHSEDEIESDSDIETEHKCDLCKTIFTSQSNLNSHLKQKHSHTELVEHYLAKYQRFVCVGCGKSKNQRQQFWNHIKNCTLAKDCGFDSFDLSHFRQYAEEVSYIYQCPRCQFQASNQEVVDTHKQSCTAEEPVRVTFNCTMCTFKGYDEASLGRHKVMRHSIKAQQCQICKKKFAHERSLKTHIERKHATQMKMKKRKEVEIICDQCGILCNSVQKFQYHNRIYHLYDTECMFCNTVFLFGDQCMVHEGIHTGDFRFSCVVCCAIFPSILNYYIHMDKKHAIQKEHAETIHKVLRKVRALLFINFCEVCKESFLEESMFYRHMSVKHHLPKSLAKVRRLNALKVMRLEVYKERIDFGYVKEQHIQFPEIKEQNQMSKFRNKTHIKKIYM